MFTLLSKAPFLCAATITLCFSSLTTFSNEALAADRVVDLSDFDSKHDHELHNPPYKLVTIKLKKTTIYLGENLVVKLPTVKHKTEYGEAFYTASIESGQALDYPVLDSNPMSFKGISVGKATVEIHVTGPGQGDYQSLANFDVWVVDRNSHSSGKK